MRGVRQRETDIELRLRSALHRRGLRFFVDRAPVAGMRSRADIVFPRVRLAIYVDGCFWHGCPEHATWPKTNDQWWRAKIEANVRRDRRVDEQLIQAGWRPVRIWEHEDPQRAVDRIAALVHSGMAGRIEAHHDPRD